MPRKAATAIVGSEEAAEAPRRSSRLSAQPQGNTTKEEAKPRKGRAPSKKRAAEDQGDAAQKKAKAEKKSGTEEEEGAEDTQDEKAETVPSKLAKIEIGDVLPTLTLKNEKDEDIEIGTLASEKGVVLFLVPKADTPGCTTQACGFRDAYPDFTATNYEVYCLSADTPAAQGKWQSKKTLPYPLISDRKRVLITALGAGEGGKTKRSHFVFEKGGKLVDKQVPVKAADSAKIALDFIKGLSKG